MARQTDDRIEQAAKRIGMDEEVTPAAIHRLSERVVELEGANRALLNALTFYRSDHDRRRWPQDGPCRCEMCEQAEKAIKAAKGQP